jgi:hypothetical protein
MTVRIIAEKRKVSKHENATSEIKRDQRNLLVMLENGSKNCRNDAI